MTPMDTGDRPEKTILYKDESYTIVGAAMNVHTVLGCGFLEPVYQEALQCELDFLQIPYQREVPLPIMYRGHYLEKRYVADFVCYDKIIVELKALATITSEHKAQVINYLRAANLELGILLNFGTTKLISERIIRVHSFHSMTTQEVIQ